MIAVHAGAGLQLDSNKSAYERVCKAACKAGLEAIKSNLSAIDAVTRAIVALEDDPLTNAGYGSNLCWDGSIECDASLMDGDRLLWAGVGAIPEIKNPIKMARQLLEEQIIEHPMGLISPNILVGEAGKRWAQDRGLSTANLMTEQARSTYIKYRRKVDKEDTLEEKTKSIRFDTVGAIAVDNHGRVAAGVSSGGIILKTPGRVGQGAVYGAGCWAQESIAITTSGSGEYLVKTLFAKECASYLLLDSSNDDLATQFQFLFKEKFTESPFLKSIKATKSVGILTVIHDAAKKRSELLWAHNTPTMCLAYSTLDSKSPKFIFSKYPGEVKPVPVIQALII